MPNNIDKLNDIATLLRNQEVFRDHVHAAVEAATVGYHADEFADMGVFGYHFWKSVTSRIRHCIGAEELELGYGGNGNDHAFKIGHHVFRVHRVDEDTLLPRGADTARDAARVVPPSPSFFDDEDDLLGPNLLVGVVATPTSGLKRIFVGELVKEDGSDSLQYGSPPVDIYRVGDSLLVNGTETPYEETPPIDVTLNDAPEEEERDEQDDVSKKEEDQRDAKNN